MFVGWMTGMYVCAALTPVLVWLGNRWPIERRVTYAAFHLCFSVAFSILSTALEGGVPLVPAGVAGTDGLMRFRRMRVAYGAPVDIDDLRDQEIGDAAKEATDRLMERILELEASL